ncbi:NAD(P)-binding protein [Zopfia rhizophila CBS 207.26]|uniref:NAD(P)-binding protein n=1 Tax=Zopfia rhizophila CBS 207.26 TaxID=1314779 RepID=A0A6A6DFN6_9PEZI|nr:NAD(P)-binding protein [Zopfia rhizophila CBS 207.26]
MDITGNGLIVGGGNGIGKACAILLAREGAAGVLIGDIDIDAANSVAAECQAVATNNQFRAEGIRVDVTHEYSVRRMFKRMVELFERVDYCVNCAGIGAQQPADIASLTLTDFQRFQDVNTTGTFLVTKEASVVMRAQKLRPVSESSPLRGNTRGSIVNLGSASSMTAAWGVLPYTTSKHATLGLTKNSALDNATYGIRVNCICPSWTDTPMVQRAVDGIEGLKDFIKEKLPIGRMAVPDEIADAVIFTLSPRVAGLPRVQRHITGHNEQGHSVFLSTDSGAHHKELVDKGALANIIYSTNSHPVELNDNVDIKFQAENEPGLTVKNGTVCRLIDFAPACESPMHRVNSIDYAIVIEGVFKMVLDSGEERYMHRGDIAVQRSTAHKWINVTGNGLLPARILFILQDVKDVYAGGQKVAGYLGPLGDDYVGLPGHPGS